MRVNKYPSSTQAHCAAVDILRLETCPQHFFCLQINRQQSASKAPLVILAELRVPLAHAAPRPARLRARALERLIERILFANQRVEHAIALRHPLPGRPTLLWRDENFIAHLARCRIDDLARVVVRQVQRVPSRHHCVAMNQIARCQLALPKQCAVECVEADKLVEQRPRTFLVGNVPKRLEDASACSDRHLRHRPVIRRGQEPRKVRPPGDGVGRLRIVIRPVIRMRPVAQSRDRLRPGKFSINIKCSPRPCHPCHVVRIRPSTNDHAICHMPRQMNALPTAFHINARPQPAGGIGRLAHARHSRRIRCLHKQCQFRRLRQFTGQLPGVIAQHHKETALRAKCPAHIGSRRIGGIQRVCQDECN